MYTDSYRMRDFVKSAMWSPYGEISYEDEAPIGVRGAKKSRFLGVTQKDPYGRTFTTQMVFLQGVDDINIKRLSHLINNAAVANVYLCFMLRKKPGIMESKREPKLLHFLQHISEPTDERFKRRVNFYNPEDKTLEVIRWDEWDGRRDYVRTKNFHLSPNRFQVPTNYGFNSIGSLNMAFPVPNFTPEEENTIEEVKRLRKDQKKLEETVEEERKKGIRNLPGVRGSEDELGDLLERLSIIEENLGTRVKAYLGE